MLRLNRVMVGFCVCLLCPMVANAEAEKASAKSQPASRKAPVAARAAAKAGPAKARSVTSTGGKVTKFFYNMAFNGKPSGSYTRREVRKADGTVVVHNRSAFKLKYWFWKVKGLNTSTLTYKNGQLSKFKVYSKVRGKESSVWGTQNGKGITIHVKKDGKTKKLFFARSKYDSTSLDLRMKMGPAGKQHKRRQLNIQQQKLMEQTYSFVKGKGGKWLGKAWDVWKVDFKSKRGKASFWFTSDGWMVRSSFKIPVGKMSMKLLKASRS